MTEGLNAIKNEGANPEGTSTNVERPVYDNDLIEWRRAKILEYHTRGHTQREISDILKVSTGTVSEDLKHIFEEAYKNQGTAIDRIFNEHVKALKALDMLLVTLWQDLENTHEVSERVQLSTQISRIYSQRLDIVNGRYLRNIAMFNVGNLEAKGAEYKKEQFAEDVELE